MNKAKFFERYKDLFHTNNFTDTLARKIPPFRVDYELPTNCESF